MSPVFPPPSAEIEEVHPMNPIRTILLSVVVALVILVIGGGVTYMVYMGDNYVSTDNAAVSVPMVTVVAPAAGAVSAVDVAVGQTVTRGQTLFALSPAGGGGKGAPATVSVPSPVGAVVAALNTSVGSVVAPGSPLATLAQPAAGVVVANVPETEIRNVSVGQSATVTLDAYPGVTFSGHVSAITPATQASLSLFPASALSGTYTKVTQLIPVTVTFDALGYRLYEGQDAEVSIHTGSASG
jgi:multidrug resistance efflux pump